MADTLLSAPRALMPVGHGSWTIYDMMMVECHSVAGRDMALTWPARPQCPHQSRAGLEDRIQVNFGQSPTSFPTQERGKKTGQVPTYDA